MNNRENTAYVGPMDQLLAQIDQLQQALQSNQQSTRQPISATTYDALAARLHELRRKIIEDKRPTYTQQSSNTVRNFQQVADLTGMTAGQVLAVYCAKHIISLMNILCSATVSDSEAETRFTDAMNYIEIGYVMWKDDKLG